MVIQRKQYEATFKARVTLEALKGRKSINEISIEYGIHPTQISQWKKHALERFPTLFLNPSWKWQ